MVGASTFSPCEFAGSPPLSPHCCLRLRRPTFPPKAPIIGAPTGSTDEQGGDGTIDTTTPLWNTSSTSSATLAVWTSGKHAVFGGTGGTITSNNASLTTGNVTFKDTAYTLVGDLDLSITGNLTAEQFGSLTVKDTLTINADLALYYGTLNVDGGSFSTSVNGYIGVDGSSNGRLNISNGGSASFVSNSVGTLASSYGFITVDGKESTLTNSGNLYIGQNGYGELTIRNGATANNAYLGYEPGASGYVTVTGADSTFTVTNNLNVGNDASGTAAGRGSLIVADGGKVSVNGGANHISLGSTSSLRIGQDNSAAGTILASYVTSGFYTSQVLFDHNEADYIFSPALNGFLAVAHSGSGTTTLAAGNGYSGGTTISFGTLRLGVSQSMGSSVGDLTLDGGTLDLNGFSQTSNLLYVTSDSIIDFSGTSSLTFSNSSALGWTGLLTILNFGAGDTFRVGTNSSGLTSEQLNRILIGGFYAQIDSLGYITAGAISAVPEPSTYAMIFGLGALGFSAWRKRRAFAPSKRHD